MADELEITFKNKLLKSVTTVSLNTLASHFIIVKLSESLHLS